MGWVQWVTLGIAVLGFGLGVFNSAHGYLRTARRLRIAEVFEPPHPPDHFLPTYAIEVVNPGHVPVAIKQVTLVLALHDQAQAIQLWEISGDGDPRKVIEPGCAETFPLPAEAMYVARMGDTARVVVHTDDRRRLERRCRLWGQFRDQAQAATAHVREPE